MKKSKTVLNEDTLQSILVRLPLKDLARCKCVCKHWNSLISRHRFLVELSPAPYVTVLITQCNYLTSLQPCKPPTRYLYHRNFIPCWPYETYEVIGTCDGLICLSPIGDLGEAVWCPSRRNYISPARPGDALVWNPFLRQYRELFFQRSLMADSFFFFGFGYDNVSSDYKVVKVTQSCIQTIVEIWNLYCTNENDPRAITLPSASVPFLLTGAAPVTVNDSCHWVAISIQSKNLELVRFDMERECFIEIPFSSDMPNIEYDVGEGFDNSVARLESNPEVEIDGKRFRLGTFNSCVCLLITTSSKVEVWCMEKNSSWRRKLEIVPEHKPYKGEQAVLGFSAKDELVTYTKDHNVYGRDPHTLKLRTALGRRTENLSQVVAYVETLVPLYSTKKLGEKERNTTNSPISYHY